LDHGKWRVTSENNNFRALIEIETPPDDVDGDGLAAVVDPLPDDIFNGFDLREAGADNLFDTADDQVYLLSVTNGEITIEDGPLGEGDYRFTVTPSLTDVVANPLDGNGDGTGDDAFVRNFQVALPASQQALLFEGRGNRGFSTAVPLTLIEDPLSSGLFHTETFGLGSVDPRFESDFFSFSAEAGDVVAINVDPLGTSFSPDITLLRPDGNQINSNRSGGPGQTAFISGMPITETGMHYVRINSSGMGTYQVRVDLGSIDE